MTRTLSVLALVVAVVAVPMYLRAQPDTPAMPITGTVLDRTGEPILGAQVMLVRRSGRQGHVGEGVSMLSRGETDAFGQFLLGAVPLKGELEFPIETSVQLEYSVIKDGANLQIQSIEFTTPRINDVITDVFAEIRIQ